GEALRETECYWVAPNADDRRGLGPCYRCAHGCRRNRYDCVDVRIADLAREPRQRLGISVRVTVHQFEIFRRAETVLVKNLQQGVAPSPPYPLRRRTFLRWRAITEQADTPDFLRRHARKLAKERQEKYG